MDEPEVIEASEPASEVELLREEVVELRDQLEAAEKENRRLWLGYHGAGGLAALIVLGPSLVRSARAWFGKVGTDPEQIPRRESADLLAAVIRRFIAVGALGLLVAGIPAILLWRQNELIADQNRYFREQNAQIREQLETQAADTRIVRRAQLLNTIYDLSDCDRSELDGDEDCPPEAPLRLREEAILALYQLDGEETNLRNAYLSDAMLADSSLAGVEFFGTDLRGSVLYRANLNGAALSKADFGGAGLIGANLTKANLSDTNFSHAVLVEANLEDAFFLNTRLNGATAIGVSFGGTSLANSDLTGADIRVSRLYGTNMEGVVGLENEQLASSCGDSNTGIPVGLKRPSHYLDRPFDPETDPPDAGCPP